MCARQVSHVADELLKTDFDAARIIYNRFGSAISFKPTIATILSPDVSLNYLPVLLITAVLPI